LQPPGGTMFETGQLVLVISPKGKRFMQALDPAKEIHTHDGRILMSDIAEAGYGGQSVGLRAQDSSYHYERLVLAWDCRVHKAPSPAA